MDIKYYLSAISNFCAAIGGGIILGKGISILDNIYLKEGSMLAFFIGTVFGIIFLSIIPKKNSTKIAKYFSFFAGTLSLLLIFIFSKYSIEGKLINYSAWIFFAFLSFRFGFWFYSRVFRAASVAGLKQKIAWVELGYYTGIISGLILWNILDINIDIVGALVIDAILQFTAGSIDLYVNVKESSESTSNIKNKILTHKHNFWYWRLAIAVALLTVGTQVIIFTLAHRVSLHFTSYILAFYYIGVSIAAYFCKTFKIQIHWHRHAFLEIHSRENTKRVNLTWYGFLNATCVGLSVFGISYWQWGTFLTKISGAEILLLTFIALAAFLYEIFALSILDRIGLEERLANTQGMIVRTYALMGICAAVSLWILG
ncbi:MAG TPA: hypothetical protein VHM20_00455, partial [Gammaproteobacteria bacterium]|nr:hypothetical protein [Gammaproteobacteria bacterium]